MPELHIRHWPTPLPYRRGTILDAALSGGVPVPHQCCSGQCGSCKCRLLKGRIEHDDYLPEALSERERSDGWVLACRARPKSDVEIDYDGKLDLGVPPPRRLNARVERRERVTADMMRLVLAPEAPPLFFKAGQFARLSFAKHPARSYSMASLPGARSLEFFIREVPNGRVSGHVAQRLAVGDPVSVEGPFGQAYLRKSDPGAVIAAAGGSGLAPVLAIAREAARVQLACPFHLYFGVRGMPDLFALSELEELTRQNFRMSLHIVLSEQPAAGEFCRAGFPHEAIEADFADLSLAQVYSAGPPPMVNAITQAALTLGAQADHIHSDPFTHEQTTSGGPVAGMISRLLRRARAP